MVYIRILKYFFLHSVKILIWLTFNLNFQVFGRITFTLLIYLHLFFSLIQFKIKIFLKLYFDTTIYILTLRRITRQSLCDKLRHFQLETSKYQSYLNLQQNQVLRSEKKTIYSIDLGEQTRLIQTDMPLQLIKNKSTRTKSTDHKMVMNGKMASSQLNGFEQLLADRKAFASTSILFRLDDSPWVNFSEPNA